MPQLVKNLPTVPETWVRSLGWEDPLEKEMATRPGILAREIPWTVRGVAKRHDSAINHHQLEMLGTWPRGEWRILAFGLPVLLPVTAAEKV